MKRIGVLIRTLIFFSVCAVPAAWIGWDFRGLPGAVAGGAAFAVLLLVVATRLESLLGRLYEIRTTESLSVVPEWRGMSATLGRLSFEFDRVQVFRSPTPGVSVIRGLGGSGRILMSQGLLAQVTEEELRQIMRLAYSRLAEPGVILQSFCALISGSVYRWTSFPLDPSAKRTPISVACFLFFLPVAEFFILLAPKIRESAPFSNAPQRIGGVSRSAVNPAQQLVSIFHS